MLRELNFDREKETLCCGKIIPAGFDRGLAVTYYFGMQGAPICNLTRGLVSLRAVLILIGLWALTQAPVFGQSVVRVEEDWEIEVSGPNAALPSPQISTQMAASSSPDYFFQFHVNYRDLPNFVPGGLQLQAWQGSGIVAAKATGSSTATIQTNDKISWTQYLDGANGTLRFGVYNGSSDTWGNFSLPTLSVPGASTVLTNYTPNYTLVNSGPVLGAQQLVAFNLKKYRLYYSDGSVADYAIPEACYTGLLFTKNYSG